MFTSGEEAMDENIQPVGSTPIGSRPEWVADSQLDKQEKYNAEKEAEEFHKALSQSSTNSSESDVGYNGDRKSKLTRNLFSENNLPI